MGEYTLGCQHENVVACIKYRRSSHTTWRRSTLPEKFLFLYIQESPELAAVFSTWRFTIMSLLSLPSSLFIQHVHPRVSWGSELPQCQQPLHYPKAWHCSLLYVFEFLSLVEEILLDSLWAYFLFPKARPWTYNTFSVFSNGRFFFHLSLNISLVNNVENGVWVG